MTNGAVVEERIIRFTDPIRTFDGASQLLGYIAKTLPVDITSKVEYNQDFRNEATSGGMSISRRRYNYVVNGTIKSSKLFICERFSMFGQDQYGPLIDSLVFRGDPIPETSVVNEDLRNKFHYDIERAIQDYFRSGREKLSFV